MKETTLSAEALAWAAVVREVNMHHLDLLDVGAVEEAQIVLAGTVLGREGGSREDGRKL